MIEIRAARPGDFTAMAAIIERGHLPIDGLEDHLQTALVASDGRGLIGLAALEVYDSGVLLRSVAVEEGWRGQGLGRQIADAALTLARARGCRAAYLLTTTAAGFFSRLGFSPIEPDEVPADVKTSVEFTSACPSSAQVMRAYLT